MYTDDGVNIQKMKIANDSSSNLTYANDVNYYRFNQTGGQIIVTSSDNNIWLAGDSGQQFENVTTINAGASSGYNTLVGNSESNIIIGGSGVSTLWGYYGDADDTLIGGTGSGIFRAGRFEGNDIIYTN